jgi:RNA polymerase sigma-70 factor (ECF subfamily)
MHPWPKTRVTLLGRLSNPRDKEAWDEFVALYGPFIYKFACRRLPQEEDAADVMQEVLSAVLKGSYQRPKGPFQKWLLTILLNEIRDFHTARGRRAEVIDGPGLAMRLEDESACAEEEWEQERRQHLFHAAAARIRERAKPIHWDIFTRTTLEHQSGHEVAEAFHLSVSNIYAIKSRILKEIKKEIDRLENLQACYPSTAITSEIIAFHCPFCKAIFRVPFTQCGTKRTCPYCQHRLQVPRPDPGEREIKPAAS